MPDFLDFSEDMVTLYRRFRMTRLDEDRRPQNPGFQDMLISAFERKVKEPGHRYGASERSQQELNRRFNLARALLDVQNDSDVARAWVRYMDASIEIVQSPAGPRKRTGSGAPINFCADRRNRK